MKPLTMNMAQAGMLLLPTSNQMLCLDVDSIVRIQASSNYSKVFCRDQAYPIVVAKVLRWFEERLPEQFFTRVHRTHLVNTKYMVSIRNNAVTLECGMVIRISRRRKKTCRAKFELDNSLL